MTPQRTKRSKASGNEQTHAERKRAERALISRIDRLIQRRLTSRELTIDLAEVVGRNLSDLADLVGREFAALRLELTTARGRTVVCPDRAH